MWARVDEPEAENYALARTGLWSAAPDTAGCTRGDPAITLVVDYDVIEMRLDGNTVYMTARSAPGHYEFLEYTLPDKDVVGFLLLAEDGTRVDGCCT